MIIAVNAVTPDFKPAFPVFLQDVFFKVATLQPKHQFILIGFDNNAAAPANCTCVNPGSKIKSPLRFGYWLNYSLPSLLAKHKADVLISYNSCSLRLKLPQLLYTDDASFLSHPEFYKPRWLAFYKRNTPKFLQKAAYIITSSGFLQGELTAHYKIGQGKYSVLCSTAPEIFKPAVNWQLKEAIKEKFTGGKEFFLYSGILNQQNNLINLLKAFSFFKQRQKSNMMLVLASQTNADATFVKSLSSYKYRADVVLAENLPVNNLAEIVTAAYALVYPVHYDAAGVNIIQALQCHTPVIASGKAALPEICGDAAVYCHEDDFNDIAAKMMLLFTNEDRRNLIIAKSREQAQKFEFTTVVKQLWPLLEKVATPA